ncbi:hypothetical protein FJT64_015605 [Amphibalanus amphitrite]|uniref:Uncharacterized protein n=1 Tax=Amphibalanus amphitrite TaxID=1232801 RepID=A0A6A4X8P3_AMPAM|nr:hypothetical protein FJT64_015605 [Amphibalanus amphitrite]
MLSCSRLGDIEPLGISGTFDHFQIRNSIVGRVGQSGLNFSATSFTIHSTEVRELSSNALDVPKRVSPEPRFGEALKARPRQCQNAGGGVTSQHDQLDCSGHREQQHDLDSEPVYCEVNDPRFVPMSHLPQGPADGVSGSGCRL